MLLTRVAQRGQVQVGAAAAQRRHRLGVPRRGSQRQRGAVAAGHMHVFMRLTCRQPSRGGVSRVQPGHRLTG